MYAKLKSAVDIVRYIGKYTKLKELSGGEYVGLCPLHHERTPSFYVNKTKQQFHCLGCGIGGDILTFIKAYHNISFMEALTVLQFESGIVVKDDGALINEARKFMKTEEESRNRVYLLDNCMDEFPESHDIKEWIDEGISADVLSKYNIRYSSDKRRIYFPIWDECGRIVAVKYRNLFDNPKYMYINKIGRKDFLYNLNFAKSAIVDSSTCIVFEGEKSVLKMETWGIHNSVAAGTHVIKSEIPLLVRLPFDNLVFAYDQDVPIKEIYQQSMLIRHYKNVYYVPTYRLETKMAPCDKGLDCWNELYGSRVKM